MPVTLFFVGHDLGHAQEALEICQKVQTSKILKRVKFCCCQQVGHGSQLMPITFLEGVIN